MKTKSVCCCDNCLRGAWKKGANDTVIFECSIDGHIIESEDTSKNLCSKYVSVDEFKPEEKFYGTD